MWIVELALKRPHTFLVMAITILLFGVLSILRMPVDIFPNIDIPIVSCAWTYTGMSPYYMENLVTTVTERALTSTVNGIQRMESISLSSMSIVKVYLNKGTDMGQSVAMVESVCSAILRQLPRGISPPFVTASSATDVPVLQLIIASDTLSEAELFDIANNLIRSQLATIQGATIPFPYGGKYRQVMIDLDPKALYAVGLSADDIVTSINDQSPIDPCGTAKMGTYEYVIVLNNTPNTIEKLNALPVKSANGAVVFLKDVAHVHDGYQPQTNIVNLNGKRAVLFNVLKNGDASTLDVVSRIKAALPRIRTIVPPACKIDVLTDQSIFVRECVDEVIRETITAALLTALLMLALLGSWRSTLIVATSIPLAILSSLICLCITGQSINSMTLGGLALAVGMLVDDATVAIENLHSNLAQGKEITQAILDGAQQVALPALVSTLSICIVFVPVIFLTEPSRSLFVPMGMAVVFAMLASYGLSRTLVPLMSKALLSGEHHQPGQENKPPQNFLLLFFHKIYLAIEKAFEAARNTYRHTLESALNNAKVTLSLFFAFIVLSLLLLPQIGQDFFPTIDGGQLRLHVCVPAGTRIENTERIFHKIESSIKKLFPKDEIEMIADNIGLPVSAINYSLSDSQTVSVADGEILAHLSEKRQHDTAYYQQKIRRMLKAEYPSYRFYFQPADIVTQILNAGLPAPIDIRIIGFNKENNYKILKDIKQKVALIPGATDVCIHQVIDAPHFGWYVDRTRAEQIGLTQKDISNSFLINLSSSFQTQPNFWLNAKNRINYNMAAQTPQNKLTSLDDLRFMSLTPTNSQTTRIEPPVLTNVATFKRSPTPSVVNHLNVAPVFDIYAACQGADLGSVSTQIKSILDKIRPGLPRGTFLFMGGQVMSMNLAFIALLSGLAFAIVLVYFLLVVNFQSWTDPFIILMAIPGALSGIIWSLFVTQTTFSIPALMGTIMTIGVASANSILMVTFANEELKKNGDSFKAALEAGYQRFRPVIMTATAMIIGMIPMAIGGGQGGSQNAPIGRAVIGGLTVATFSTLFLVPLIFSISRKKKDQKH
ncbi:MAG: efflux RND transporter permease subunit [Candidatus Obscuribacterales bacterium]|nr:efflux RND transporter permease subunit [Candidatus Obscuribacterales bacterium]